MVNLNDYELVEGFCWDCPFYGMAECPGGCVEDKLFVWRKKLSPANQSHHDNLVETILNMLKAGEFSPDEIEKFRDALK